MTKQDLTQKEPAIAEIIHKVRSLRLMRNEENMYDLGRLVTQTVLAFGDTDARLVQARETIKSDPRVMKVLLQRTEESLSTVPNAIARMNATNIFRTFYPDTPTDATDFDIQLLAVGELNKLAKSKSRTRQ